MICIGLLSLFTQVILTLRGRPLPIPITVVTLGALGALAYAYSSNRMGRYTPAAVLTITVVNAGIWAVIVAIPAALETNTLLMSFLAIPLLVCGILMTIPLNIALAAINIAFVGFIHLAVPGRTFESLYFTLFFVCTISALTIVDVILRQRDRAEIDRQTKALAESNAELQTNASKLSTLFEVLPVGVSMLNTQQQIVDANPALLQILKISSEGLATGTYTGRKYIHPDGTPIQPEEFASAQAMEKQKPVLEIETGVITETGETIWTSVSAAPLSMHDLAAVTVTTDITERKRAEEELQKLSQKDEEALRLSQMVRWEFDLATAQFIFNDQYYTLHGTTAEAAGGYQMSVAQFVSRYVHPDDSQIVGDAIQKALEKNDPNLLVERETRILRANGEARNVVTWFRVEQDFQGRPTRLVGVNQDITERKQAEVALAATEKRFRALIENAPDLIMVVAPDGITRYASPSMQHILGYKPDEIIGTNAFALIHPDDLVRVGELFAQTMTSAGNLAPVEFRLLHRDGSWRSMDGVGASSMDETGQMQGVMNARDITERKQAEARFRGALDSAPDAIVIVNQNGTIALANAQTEKIFGYPREELLGQSIELLIPESLRDRHIRHRAGYVANPHTRPMGAGLELNCLRTDGTQLPVEISLSPLETEGDTLIMASIRDITERKLAEQVLNELNEKLANSVVEVEQRSREIALLNEMGSLLQTCLNSEEAYGLIARFSSQLFANTRSALCMINASRNIVEVLGGLGQSSTMSILSVFQPQDCWALRRGQQYEFHAGEFNQPCYHFPDPAPQAYTCVPLMAQGEMLGLFHMQMTEPLPTTEKFFTRAQLRLAQTLADSASLALANLQLRERLSQQSIRDPLTNLFNRRYLEESLERELRRAARSKYPVGVIMLDLDHFKRFNDTFGHEAGDTVLREIGSFLSQHIRGGDIVCRYGGEEFTLILPEASLAITQQRAERLRESVKNLQIQDRDRPLGTITFSCGVAVFPDHGATPETVLQAADAALYRAKHEGRDRVSVSE
jgi:diguanylate cyclase (GGDEF)-like protein/PAS domain S-box-containing protein